MLRRNLFSAVVACIAAACGSEDRGVTQPTPHRAVARAQIHDTLNHPGSRTIRGLAGSALRNSTPGFLGFVDAQTYDDFTSAVGTAIRTVSWQGGYCGGGSFAPVPPPVATSRSFEITFYADAN